MLKHLDLFSGIGGFALACEWAGIETIGFVEIDKFCQKILRKHWLDVPIVEDIRNVKEIKQIVAYTNQNSKPELPNNENKGQRQLVQTRNNERESPTILITAGFPCQPFSVAGKRQGERDDRYLWPETLAVIKAIEPRWVLLENVTGIINLALNTVLSDMEGAGYSTETLIIPACAVNAWHRRDRIWIIANFIGKGLEKRTKQNLLGQCKTIKRDSFTTNSARAKDRGIQFGQFPPNASTSSNQRGETDWWATEPELGRVAYGIPNRVDRLKCLGNAIVPQVAYEIIKTMIEIDKVFQKPNEIKTT